MKLKPSLIGHVLALAALPQAPAEPPEWIHLVPFGEWRGHPWRPFAIGQPEAQQIIRNFEARGGNKLVVDYEHQTLNAEWNGQPAPAAGWVDRLELRADGVWGHVEMWTDRAQGHLRAREYRYLSPVLCFDHVNKASGVPEGVYLHSAALTNVPFLDELQPVTNSDGALSEESPMDELKKLLGLAVDATDDQVIAALREHIALRDQVLAVVQPEGTVSLSELGARLSALLAEWATPLDLGRVALAELAPQAGEDLVALRTRLDQTLKHSGYVPIAEHVAALTDGAAQVVALSDEQLVDQGKREGKITPALDGWFRRQLTRDREGALAWLRQTTPTVPLRSPITGPVTPVPRSTLDPVEKAVARQLGLSDEQFAAAKESA